MISPLGTMIQLYNSGLDSATASLTGLISQEVPGPLGAGMCLLFIKQGMDVARGNSEPLRDLVPLLLRFAIVYWLITNPAEYLYWVRDVGLTGLPTALIVSATGFSGDTVATQAGLAGVLDGLYAQQHEAAGRVGAVMGGDPLGITQAMNAFYIAVAGSGGLWVCTYVDMVCQFLKTLMVVIGGVMLACWNFPMLKHLTLAWKGVMISLALGEVLTFCTMQIALLGVQPLMARQTNALITTLTQPAAAADALQCLAAMGGILWTAALVVAAVPVVTFFMARGGAAPSALAVQPIRS